MPHDIAVKAAVGDKVAFDFRQRPDGQFEITKIEAAK
jgi:hypothetical protein